MSFKLGALEPQDLNLYNKKWFTPLSLKQSMVSEIRRYTKYFVSSFQLYLTWFFSTKNPTKKYLYLVSTTKASSRAAAVGFYQIGYLFLHLTQSKAILEIAIRTFFILMCL